MRARKQPTGERRSWSRPETRKGTEDVFDPEGILDEEDEEMDMSSEDKETQTGNLLQDGKDIATQVNLKRTCKTVGSQTGRSLQRMSMDEPDLTRSGQYLTIRAGRKAADSTMAIGSTGRGEGVRMKVEEGGFCSAGDKRRLSSGSGWTR